jgi:hypothetical protein
MPLIRAATICSALFASAPQAFCSPPATTTTLAITANGSPVTTTLIQGNLVTLTATVTSISSGTPVTPGQVEFCDLTPTPGVPAPYCTDIHQLALAQLSSTGTATFHFFPPAGNRSYKAIFLGTTGTNNYAPSASSPQNFAVTQSSYQYLSSTSLASSGAPGSYTLTATVTGGSDPAAPSGTVSFIDTSNSVNPNYVLDTANLAPLISQLTFNNSFNSSLGGISPGSFVTADFNGDGIPDLAVPAFGVGTTGTIAILLGNGDGTFNPAPSITTPHAIELTKVADFNGDGIPDLVMVESLVASPHTIAWLQVELGKGDGTFTPSPPVLLPDSNSGFPQFSFLAVGDFNGDGKPDLVLQYSAITPTLASYLLFFPGNGDGTFAPPAPAYQFPSSITCMSMAVADFNGDGNLDLACPNQEVIPPNGDYTPPPGNISVLLGNGDGTFRFGSNVPVGAGPYYVVVADFNGDGKADLATAGWFYPTPSSPVTTVSIALGIGDGTFSPYIRLTASLNAETSVVAGDFNGDGTPDLAAIYGTVGNGGNNIITVYLSNGDGTFSPPNNVTLNSPITGVSASVASDFNADGRWDLALMRIGGAPGGPIGMFLSEPTSATATVTGISPVGNTIHLVDASYPGSAPVLSPSLSNTVGLQAEPVPTTLTLTASPTTGIYQQPFTLTATPLPNTAQDHTASGSVTFYNNGATLGTVTLANGAATLTVSTVLSIGTYNLTATYSGDTNFVASNGSLQYTIAPAPPPITFTVPDHTFGDTPFTVLATSASLGAFTYSVVSGPATISGSTVTLIGAGTVVLQASQAASGNYVSFSKNAHFTVAQESQTIAFAAPSSPVAYASGPIALSATATSGLTVAFSVLPGPATLSGSTLTITGVGTVVVAADQPGNQNYLAAPEVTHTILVNKGLPLIKVAASPNPVFLLTPVTLTATVSSTAATPTGSITFSDGSTVLGQAPLNAGVASFPLSTLPLGSNPITAAYSGDGNYNAATSQPADEAIQDFTLTVTGNPTQTIQYGGIATYALSVTSIDGPTIPSAITLAASGAPTGSTIALSPATLPAGSPAANLTLTIQVPSVIAASQHRLRSPAPTLTALALLGLVIPFRRRLNRHQKFAGRMACILLLLAGFSASAALTGCGASIILPRVQTFALTLTATSGALSHATAATLIVQ